MNKVSITSLAKSDILNIKEYIASSNTVGANYFVESLISVFEMLAEFPYVGVKKAGIKNQNIQIYTIRKKYNIIYRVKDGDIEILRVLNRYQNLFAVL